jgi:hypothetical protein
MTTSGATAGSRWAAAILALAAFAAYSVTLAPGLTGGDSGELICAAAGLGVAHPPGYPLWTMLAHGFTWMPWGTLAWRLNLFSALCTAAATGILCRVIQSWTGQTWAGVCGAGLFAFSPLVWEYARQAEVFALNNLLLVVVLATATRFAAAPFARSAVLCALASGLALSHHHTAFFLVAPVAAWVFVRLLNPAAGRWQRLAAAAAGAAVGLLPYAYLPLAAHYSSGWCWGECDSLRGFLAHFLRREYGTFQLASGEAAKSVPLWLLLQHYAAAAVIGLTYVGLPLAVVGIGSLWFKKTLGKFHGLALVAVLALAAYLLLFQSLVNLTPDDPLLAGVLARFWMMPDLLLAVFAGVGFAVLLPAGARPSWLSPALSTGLIIGAATLHSRTLAPHSDLIARYGRAILQPLPENAVLLVRGDLPANAIRYVQTAEKLRPDVVVLDLELLTRDWYVRQMKTHHPELAFPGRIYDPAPTDGFTLASWVAANRPAHSIWLYPEPKPGDPTASSLSLWPRGFAQEVLPGSAPAPDTASWESADQAELKKLRDQFSQALSDAPGTWERVTAQDYWSAEHRHAFTLLRLALAQPGNAPALARARAAYEQFVSNCPESPWYAWKNLGLICERQAAPDPQARARQLAAWRAYLQIAPATDPDRSTIAEFLQRNQ